MNIYFSGIGGVGLSPLAQMALDAGYSVTGSDMSAGLATDELAGLGIQVHIGEQDGTYLRKIHSNTPIDFFVYTAALPSNHPELVAARELGLRVVKRDGLIAHIINESGQKLIAIAGTHGKTTATGMTVWGFKQLGIPVSYSIGSQISFGPSGKFDPSAEYFVYECDEFDRNFLNFHPYLSVVTSIDYDHPDTYPTEDDYKKAFRDFLGQSDAAILWSQDADFIDYSGNNTSWILQANETLPLQLPGEHNRRNATLIAKAIERLSLNGARVSRDGVTPAEPSKASEDGVARVTGPVDSDLREPANDGSGGDIFNILEIFPGTVRRFEKLAENLYSDYGHHPVEIAATLQMARELSDHVVLVYQPHQNVRQHEIRDQYTDCFEQAETVYWLPTYLSREDPNLPVLTVDDLTKNVTVPERIHPADLNDELWEKVQRARDEDKLVVFMGAGSIDGWVREQIASL